MPGARSWDDPNLMTSVDDVQARMLELVAPLEPVEVDLAGASGLILAQDVIADVDVPPFRNSAMDGYAIRTENLAYPDAAQFTVAGTIPAGHEKLVKLDPGQAARIMTGAPVPDEADAVVRFEEVEEIGSNEIRISSPVHPGDNIRLAGEDILRGDVVLGRGRLLGAGEIGTLAALNIPRVGVHRRPRVGILSTGDEVVELGVALGTGQIRDANSYALAAAVSGLGATPVRLGIAADRHADLELRLRDAAGCDLIMSSGGVSTGDFDLVKEFLRAQGEVEVLTVRMKPGKPLAIGKLGETAFVGLPGNPVAAIVAFDQFARPAILRMLGHSQISLPMIKATLEAPIQNRGGRRHFERGRLRFDGRSWFVAPTGIHGSAMLTSLLAANCYIVVEEGCSLAQAGTTIGVQILDPRSIFWGPPQETGIEGDTGHEET